MRIKKRPSVRRHLGDLGLWGFWGFRGVHIERWIKLDLALFFKNAKTTQPLFPNFKDQHSFTTFPLPYIYSNKKIYLMSSFFETMSYLCR
jgi:hypothetical protein